MSHPYLVLRCSGSVILDTFFTEVLRMFYEIAEE